MQCVSPLSLENPNGTKERLVVPCGRCGFCLSNFRSDWAFRLDQELKVSESAHFLTMTYNEECLPWGETKPTLDKRDTQLFMKKLRKINLNKIMKTTNHPTRAIANRLEPSLRYYTVGEYGTETERPHYHSIMFNLQPGMPEALNEIWGLGHVHVGDVTPASINYVCKYLINKHDVIEGVQKQFATMSRNPGLGSNYLKTENYHVETRTTQVKNRDGNRQRLPRFYKEKFFTKHDLETLALSSKSEGLARRKTEDERIIKLGNDPEKYLREQQEKQLSNILKTNKTETL